MKATPVFVFIVSFLSVIFLYLFVIRGWQCQLTSRKCQKVFWGKYWTKSSCEEKCQKKMEKLWVKTKTKSPPQVVNEDEFVKITF